MWDTESVICEKEKKSDKGNIAAVVAKQSEVEARGLEISTTWASWWNCLK
jgi:hypothetical protein